MLVIQTTKHTSRGKYFMPHRYQTFNKLKYLYTNVNCHFTIKMLFYLHLQTNLNHYERNLALKTSQNPSSHLFPMFFSHIQNRCNRHFCFLYIPSIASALVSNINNADFQIP